MALKLSKSFNFQGLTEKNIEQLILKNYRVFFEAKILRMIMGYKILLTIITQLIALTTC